MFVGMAAGIWTLVPGEHASMLGRLPLLTLREQVILPLGK
jgi:hypothetical protein